MKHKKYVKTAALVLAIVMLLGLAACGGGSGSQPQGGGQVYQPPVNEPVTPAEPVQTAPPATDAPAVSTDLSGWYGVWDSGGWLLEINPTYAFLYRLGSDQVNWWEVVCIENIYDCSYTINGNTMILSDGLQTLELTMQNDCLFMDGSPELTKICNNTGLTDNIIGTWRTLGVDFHFQAHSSFLAGDEITFYGDNTCQYRYADASDGYSGCYTLTSMFDNPAIVISGDLNGEVGPYEYDFLSNDLLMIYTDNERCFGYLLYRVS